MSLGAMRPGWISAAGLAGFVLAAALAFGPAPVRAQDEPLGGIEQVESLVRQGALDRALVRAKALVAERPGDVDVHVVYQDVARLVRDEKEVVREYKTAAKEESATADAIYLHGRLLDGRTAQAELRRALKVDPAHVRTLLALGDLYLAEGQLGDATAALEQAAKAAPALAAPHLGLAQAARLRDAPAEVEAALRRAIELEPAHVLARVELGALLFQSGRYDDARVLLEETAALAPADPLPELALGQLERVLARDEVAMRELRKKEEAAAAGAALAGPDAGKADPAKPDAGDGGKDDGAKDDGGGKEPEKPATPEGRALAAFQAAAEIDTHSIDALVLLAHSAIVTDQPIVARGALNVAEKLAPSHTQVRLMRAYLEIRAGTLSTAGKVMDELLKEQRELAAGLYVRGVAREMEGSARKAEKDYEQAVREAKEDPIFHRALGALYALQAKWKDAIAAYETVVKLTDSHPDALWDLARAQRWAAKPKDAAATLEALVATDPDSLHGWLELGQVCQFELRKQERRAAQAYRAYIDLGGDNEDVPGWLAECERIAGGR